MSERFDIILEHEVTCDGCGLQLSKRHKVAWPQVKLANVDIVAASVTDAKIAVRNEANAWLFSYRKAFCPKCSAIIRKAQEP